MLLEFEGAYLKKKNGSLWNLKELIQKNKMLILIYNTLYMTG